MRGSDKGEEPSELQDWKAGQLAAGIEPRYDDVSASARQAAKQTIFIEQTGQCVYCGRAILLTEYNTHHVEHFRPRAQYPDRELDFENLFISCGPQQRLGGPQQTCGNKKKAWFDENCHVEPSPEEACQGRFVFVSDGRIRGDGTPESDKMIDILNLNYPELIAERSTLIEELDAELSKGVPTCELIESFRHLSTEGARVSFSNVAIHYLQK